MSTKGLFRKTKLCKFYQGGCCKLMEACGFAHGEEELASVPDPCAKLCKKFLGTGSCRKGAACSFAHCREEEKEEEEDARARAAGVGDPDLQPGLRVAAGESASHVSETRGDEAMVTAVQLSPTQARQQLVLAALCCVPVIVPVPPHAHAPEASWPAGGGPKSGAPQAGEIGADVVGVPCGECEDPFVLRDRLSRQSTEADVLLSHANSSQWGSEGSELNPADGELEEDPQRPSLPRTARALGLAYRERKTFLDFAYLEPDDDGLLRPLRRVRSAGDFGAAMNLSQ